MAIIGEITVGVVVGVVSAVVSTKATLQLYRAERWWDEKYKAYTAILNSLHSLLQNIDAYYEELKSGKDISADEEAKLNRKYKDSIEEIDRQITLGTFLLQQEAADALNLLKEKLDVAKKKDAYFDYLQYSDQAYRMALTSISKTAKTELSVKPLSHFLRWWIQ